MQLTPIMYDILTLVDQHNGEWYWYQIDRCLSTRYPDQPGPYNEMIHILKDAGLLEIRPHAGPGSIRYWITESGKAYLQQRSLT